MALNKTGYSKLYVNFILLIHTHLIFRKLMLFLICHSIAVSVINTVLEARLGALPNVRPWK